MHAIMAKRMIDIELKKRKNELPLKLSKTSKFWDQNPTLQPLKIPSKNLRSMVEVCGYEVWCNRPRTIHFLSLNIETKRKIYIFALTKI